MATDTHNAGLHSGHLVGLGRGILMSSLVLVLLALGGIGFLMWYSYAQDDPAPDALVVEPTP